MNQLAIRRAEPQERLHLEELQRRASLALDEFRAELEAYPDAICLPAEHIDSGSVLVAQEDGAIVGFAVLLTREAAAELDGLFVEPMHWKRGIGRALVLETIHEARRLGLSLTVVANPSASRFYEQCGFTVEGVTQTRFGPALRMSR